MTLLLLIILTATALPVFLWHRTRPLGIYVLALYGTYCFLVRDWLYGDLTYCHDTYQGLQFYFNITRQWVHSGVEFGWNPYLGAGQPMAIMSNLYLWLPAILLAKAESILGITLSPFEFANLTYLSMMFFSATGMVMLLRLMFRNGWVLFFGVSVFAWGGMFVYNLHQVWPLVIAYPLAYALFFLLHSYKSGTWAGLILFSVFTGTLANHYIPLYVYIILFLTLMGIGFNFRRLKIWWRKLRPGKNWKWGTLCLLIYGLSASPFLYSYFEMKDFVSPSRGFTQHGTISSQNTGENIPVSAPLPSYMNLFNSQWVQWENNYYLHAAYLGAIPAILLFSFLPGVLARDRIIRGMVFPVVVLMLLGLGYNTPLWGLLVDYVPFFNMFRHPAIFSSAVPFFLVAMATACLNYFTRITELSWIEIAQLGSGVAMFALFSNIHFEGEVVDLTFHLLICAFLMIVVCVLTYIKLGKNKKPPVLNVSPRFIPMTLGVFLLINLVELGLYTTESIRLSPDYEKKYLFSREPDLRTINILLRPVTGLCRVSDYELKPMAYPEKWVSRCITCSRDFSPFQITPMIEKRNIWSHMDPNFLFMLQKDFAKEYRAILMPLNRDGKVLEGNMFYLAPDDTGWTFNRKGYGWLTSLQEKSLNFVGVPGSNGLGSIEVLPSNDPSQIRIKINATRDAYILRMENYHPGWKATVDGNPVPVQKAEPLFQTIPVPQGEHLVEFRFESMFNLLVQVSIGVTLSGWLGVFFWLNRAGYTSRIRN